MNFKELAENLGMTEEDYLEIVELFVETGISDLDKLNSAVKKGDKEGAANAAHSLKGAAGNLGFTDLYEAAKMVEQKARSDSLNEIAEDAKLLKEKLDVIAKASIKDG